MGACPSCGADNSDNATYCTLCFASLAGVSKPDSQPADSAVEPRIVVVDAAAPAPRLPEPPQLRIPWALVLSVFAVVVAAGLAITLRIGDTGAGFSARGRSVLPAMKVAVVDDRSGNPLSGAMVEVGVVRQDGTFVDDYLVPVAGGIVQLGDAPVAGGTPGSDKVVITGLAPGFAHSSGRAWTYFPLGGVPDSWPGQVTLRLERLDGDETAWAQTASQIAYESFADTILSDPADSTRRLPAEGVVAAYKQAWHDGYFARWPNGAHMEQVEMWWADESGR